MAETPRKRAVADLLSCIQQANAGREAERLRLKYQKMAQSPLAFLRGSCHRYYEQLPRSGVFKTAPVVWACGDLHLENFGSYRGDNGLVYFDINDFDEGALAPASWDLVRLLSSVELAGREQGLRRADTRALCAACVTAYADALLAGKAGWVERDTAQGPVRELLTALRERTRAAWLKQRSRGSGASRRLRVDGKKALAATAAQRAGVTAFMAQWARSQPDPAFFEVLDVARRIAGTGSLGLARYVVLVRGKGTANGQYLLDLKNAPASSLVPQLALRQARWATQAQRIVAVQQRLQAVSMAFLQAVEMDGRPFVLRALQPSEDRITLNACTDAAALHNLVQTLGRISAWAQLRSSGREGSATADGLMAWAARSKWRGHLLDAAEDCTARVRADAAAFKQAWAAGRLTVPEET